MMLDDICRKCGSTSLRPSRTRSLLDALLAFLIVPYRCRHCDTRQIKLKTVVIDSAPSQYGKKAEHHREETEDREDDE